MNKLRIICIGLLILFLVLIALIILKRKHREEVKQKAVLVQEHLMLDIYQGRKASFEGVPADGLWRNRIADNIGEVRIRRQMATPDILEVQIVSKNDPSQASNFKIRIH